MTIKISTKKRLAIMQWQVFSCYLSVSNRNLSYRDGMPVSGANGSLGT